MKTRKSWSFRTKGFYWSSFMFLQECSQHLQKPFWWNYRSRSESRSKSLDQHSGGSTPPVADGCQSVLAGLQVVDHVTYNSCPRHPDRRNPDFIHPFLLFWTGCFGYSVTISWIIPADPQFLTGTVIPVSGVDLLSQQQTGTTNPHQKLEFWVTSSGWGFYKTEHFLSD